MTAGGAAGEEIIAGINVTPLVDITLVLLVIFIVTAKLMVTPAVPLDLPRAARTEAIDVVFEVLVPADGPLRAGGVALASDGELVARARAVGAREPGVRAVIQADGDVTHRRILRVLDLLREAGVTRIAFAARPADESAGD